MQLCKRLRYAFLLCCSVCVKWISLWATCVLFPSWRFLTTHCICNWNTYHLSTSSLKINQSIDHFCPNVTYKTDWALQTSYLLRALLTTHLSYFMYYVVTVFSIDKESPLSLFILLYIYICIDDGMRLMLLLGCQCHLPSSRLGVLSVWMCMSSRICHCNNTRNNI